MPKPLKLASLPSAILELAQALERLDEITIPTASPSEARSLRFRLYAIRRTLQRDALTHLYPNFCTYTIAVEGPTVILRHPDKSPAYAPIAAALAIMRQGTSTPANLDDHAAGETSGNSTSEMLPQPASTPGGLAATTASATAAMPPAPAFPSEIPESAILSYLQATKTP